MPRISVPTPLSFCPPTGHLHICRQQQHAGEYNESHPVIEAGRISARHHQTTLEREWHGLRVGVWDDPRIIEPGTSRALFLGRSHSVRHWDMVLQTGERPDSGSTGSLRLFEKQAGTG